jgi:crossover junction endodeoxyribonuclease RuvC
MKALGVDPGITGGIALVETLADDKTMLVDAMDIPVIGTGAKERVDILAIRTWIAQHCPTFAAIERAQAMPRQGVSSGFKYGRSVGAIEAAVALSEIPVTIVEPSMWKRFFRLPGKDKEAARQRALELFPAAHTLLARKKDHGRAEAALIALFGIKNSHLSVAPSGAQPGSEKQQLNQLELSRS